MSVAAPKKPVHILHLEDDENDRILVREMAAANDLEAEWFAVQTRADLESALRQRKFDVIVSDYSMPSFNGLSGLMIAREMAPETPFLFFSGTIGEESAVESLRNGAVDYVIKSRPQRLIPAIRQALRTVEEKMLLQQTEQKNREQAELLDKATDAILVCDLANRITYWNRSAERIYGWTAEEVVEKDFVKILFQGKPPTQILEMKKSMQEKSEWAGELQQLTKDNKPVLVQCRATLIRNANGQPKSLLLINTDFTERKQLEEQFMRSQRLESLGVLISGIAHDLNNALAPILIGVDILRRSPEKDDVLKTIEVSAKRGADMVKQVLTFARGSDSNKTPIRMESLVKEMGKIVNDTFPKNIHCEVKSGGEIWNIMGLATPLYQVLLNLCVNARDAMPDGGSLTIMAENVSVDAETAARYPDAKPGDYVCVSVADTGMGIPPEQMEKIFRPFYTTKGPGKGTGLGLSTSANIIKNHGGFLVVDSAVGHGTEFKFYLPAVIERSPASATPSPLPMGNGESILVVDDEAIVLVIARTALENYGYRVLTATNGLEAISLLNERSKSIDLVITDMAMPLMDGAVTASALRRIKPGIKIIAAGESGTEAADAMGQSEMDAFLAKPFTVEKLLKTAQAVLKNGSHNGSHNGVHN
ncbi:MAG TPA: response regulator [Verrucomicrobiae bacterium]|jgi:PAS domain S-box-containing protein